MKGQKRLLAAKVVEWLALALVPVLSAVRITYPESNGSPASFVQFLHRSFLESYVYILGTLGILGVVAKIAQEYLNPESKIRLKATLDAFFEAFFADAPESVRYTNRATLFKANSKRTELVPYCRSGTQYQKGIQSFQVNDNNEYANEGIAGQAWFRNTTVGVHNLSECPNPWTDTDQKCQKYAQEGLLPLSKAKGLHVKSRSILATPVRDFHGNQWGVLVLDSRKPNGVDPQKENLIKAFVATLGKML